MEYREEFSTDITKPESYAEICQYYSKEYFKKKLYLKIKETVTKEYGGDSAKELLDFLDNEVIVINNIADFLQNSEDFDNFLFSESIKSLDELTVKTILYIQKNITEGSNELILTNLFITFAHILEKSNKNNESISYFYKNLEQIIYSCLTLNKNTSVIFRKLDKSLFNFINLTYSVSSGYYEAVWKMVTHILNKLKSNFNLLNIKIPEVITITGSTNLNLKKMHSVLLDTFDISPLQLEELITKIDVRGFNVELETFLKSLKCTKESFKEIKNKTRLKKLTPKLTETTSTICVLTDFFIKTPLSEQKYIFINLDKTDSNYLEYLISYAAILTKIPRLKNQSFKIIIRGLDFKPTITLAKRLEKKLEEIRRIHKESLYLEVQFLPEISRVKAFSPTQVSFISDIHYDLNQEHHPIIKTSKNFIINCGDTSGSLDCTIDWIKRNMKYGVFTHGNHMGYNDRTPVEDQIQILKEQFPLDADVSYLNNSYKEYNGIIFIGACLYTNFQLYGKDNVKKHKLLAQYNMNDFKRVRRREGNLIRYVTPNDYIQWYKESVGYISETALKFIDKPVVVLTHFAPLPFSIHAKYKGDPLNAAFISDLRQLLDSRPNIVLWAHGHCHDSFNYMYNKTRIICEPYGYFYERIKDNKNSHYPQIGLFLEEIKNRSYNPDKIKRYYYYNWNGESIVN